MNTKREWYACDGQGHVPDVDTQIEKPTFRVPDVTRRNLLLGTGMGLLGWLSQRSALADFAIKPGADPDHVFVVLFLRGGADGMSLLVPYKEDAYYRARPNLAVPAPNDKRYREGNRALDLNGQFGFHPLLAPLMPIYKEGNLLALHAVGSQDHTRSHFEAMSAMERGLTDSTAGPSSGWIARHLLATERNDDSPLRAVAFSSIMPDSLRGATHATVLNSLSEYKLDLEDAGRGPAAKALARLYDVGTDEVAVAGRSTLSTLKTLSKLDPDKYKPSNGATYPDSPLSHGFRQTACLIRARVGVEVACLEGGGWDTHVAQGTNVPQGQNVGIIGNLIMDLGSCLAAFNQDMGKEMKKITVVVMTEFGRRLNENNGIGTDHGRGSAMFVMGGGVKGGRVLANWPGLEEKQLDEVGDLRVTTDYRSVLAEILAKRCGGKDLSKVFAGHKPEFLGVM